MQVVGFKNGYKYKEGGLHSNIGTRRILSKATRIQGVVQSDGNYSTSGPFNTHLSVPKGHEILQCLDEKNGSNCKLHSHNDVKQLPHGTSSPTVFMNNEQQLFLNHTSYVFPKYNEKKREAKRNIHENEDSPWSQLSPIGKNIKNDI